MCLGDQGASYFCLLIPYITTSVRLLRLFGAAAPFWRSCAKKAQLRQKGAERKFRVSLQVHILTQCSGKCDDAAFTVTCGCSPCDVWRRTWPTTVGARKDDA